MPVQRPIVIINDGGMDGLVARGTLNEESRVIPVFVRTGFEGERWWWDCFERQLEAFGQGGTEILEMRHLVVPGLGSDRGGDAAAPTSAPLSRLGRLTAAAGLAIERRAKALVWPVRVGADEDQIATITEMLILLGDLIRLEHGERLAIETPLLELTDAELVEVGQQMGLDWSLSRSCYGDEAEPCGTCAGCGQRRAMLSAAGIEEKLGAGQ